MLNEALEAWKRLSVIERDDFFAALLQSALRLDKPALLAWLSDELGRPPLASCDLSGLTLSEADLAALAADARRRDD